MNILLVSSKYMPEYSGSGFRAHNLYKRLTKKYSEIELDIICGSITENSILSYQYDEFDIMRIACKKYSTISSFLPLKILQNSINFKTEYNATYNYIKNLKKQPELIHIFGQNFVTSAALNYANDYNIPVLIELCNEMDTPHHYIPFPFKYFISGMPPEKYCFISISECLKKMCLHNGIPEDKIWCRPNPVDEDLFKPIQEKEKYALRKTLTPFDSDDIVVSYVAKFRESKNHIFLLKVLLQLDEKYKFVITGPMAEFGPEVESCHNLFADMQNFIKENKLENRVMLTSGFVHNVDEFYKLSDVYAFPTKNEGLGTPMLEALACGVPVVANLIPGVTDYWIENNRNGFVSELIPELFAENIIKASNFPENIRIQEARKIINVAGTEAIDSQYWSLINK